MRVPIQQKLLTFIQQNINWSTRFHIRLEYQTLLQERILKGFALIQKKMNHHTV